MSLNSNKHHKMSCKNYCPLITYNIRLSTSDVNYLHWSKRNSLATKRVGACVRNATAKHACIVWLDRTAIFKVKLSCLSRHHCFLSSQTILASMLCDRFMDPFLYSFCYRRIKDVKIVLVWSIGEGGWGSVKKGGIEHMPAFETRCTVIRSFLPG